MGANLLLGRDRAVFAQSPFYREVRNLAAKADFPAFDAILVSDLEAVPLALEVAAGRPVVGDLREYYPTHFIQDRKWRTFFRPLMVRLTRTVLPDCAGAVTVSPGIVELYEREFGIKTTLVSNAAQGRSPGFRPTGEVIRLIHSGQANPNRRIEAMIEAVEGLDHLTLDLYLVVPDHLRGYGRALESLADSTRNVRIHPPVKPADLPALHDGYDMGIAVAPSDNPQVNYSLPNKFFDYLQSGLAIVAGPMQGMADILRAEGLGPILEEFGVPQLRQLLADCTPETVDSWKKASCTTALRMTADEQAENLRREVGLALARQV